MTALARVVRFVEPFRVEIAEQPVPEPRPGELVIRADYSGISGGTELLAYRGEIDPRLPLDETLGALAGTFEFPFAYGYSVVGTVERSAAPVPEGSRVFAFHPHQDRFVVGADDVVALDHVPAREGTLFPLVETALQVCLDAEPGLCEVVAVLGLGPVGVLTAALLRRAGAEVVAAEPLSGRREAAAAFGIAAVSPAELADAVRDATGGRGVGVVVEASGNPEALADGLALLAHEGVALVCSWYGTKPVSLPLGAEFHRRRLEIRSSQVSSLPSRLAGRWDRARRRQAARALLDELPLAALATHEVPFEQAAGAYELLDRGDPDVVHVALRYG